MHFSQLLVTLGGQCFTERERRGKKTFSKVVQKEEFSSIAPERAIFPALERVSVTLSLRKPPFRERDEKKMFS